MKKVSSLLLPITASFILAACASNPNKAEKLNTEIQKTDDMGGGTVIGLNEKDEMVMQKKIRLADYVRQLQFEVYGLEDTIYGGDESGNRGLWGVLEECQTKENSAEMGGEGTYVKMPEKARLTDREDQFQKIGLDEKKNLVAVSTDYLRDRIRRFENYKATYKKRKDWYETQVKICNANLERKTYNAKQAKLDLSKYPPITNTTSELDRYVCRYVRQGAKMNDLVKTALSKQWIMKEDFDQDMPVNSLKVVDSNQAERPNVLRLGGWALAFDKGAKLSEIEDNTTNPSLKSWMNDSADIVPGGKNCLRRGSNLWNN
ncbi:YajG family lipoprotein [Bdellovibrio svalbardensis]|uniref:Lipoprotein n=1 Tax=Bdellovibrio svalbardensis TaxID=2972972 RepID=A0ABT6DG00_9BACT|nr:hypothetical protein [Bdellovibrio svalbardensis]MDG0815757.1 hypothetical protein [Bdellovibrio svalbardensis]